MTTTEQDPPKRTRKKAEEKVQKILADANGPLKPPIPEEVQDAAENYAEVLKAKNKASAKLTSVKEDLLTVMKEHNVFSVTIQTDKGEKVVERVEDEKLKFRKPHAGIDPVDHEDGNEDE